MISRIRTITNSPNPTPGITKSEGNGDLIALMVSRSIYRKTGKGELVPIMTYLPCLPWSSLDLYHFTEVGNEYTDSYDGKAGCDHCCSRCNRPCREINLSQGLPDQNSRKSSMCAQGRLIIISKIIPPTTYDKIRFLFAKTNQVTRSNRVDIYDLQKTETSIP